MKMGKNVKYLWLRGEVSFFKHIPHRHPYTQNKHAIIFLRNNLLVSIERWSRFFQALNLNIIKNFFAFRSFSPLVMKLIFMESEGKLDGCVGGWIIFDLMCFTKEKQFRPHR